MTQKTHSAHVLSSPWRLATFLDPRSSESFGPRRLIRSLGRAAALPERTFHRFTQSLRSRPAENRQVFVFASVCLKVVPSAGQCQRQLYSRTCVARVQQKAGFVRKEMSKEVSPAL